MAMPKKKTEVISNRGPHEAEVKLVHINSVKLWEGNPRNNDDAAQALSKILERHGQRSPIVVWRKNSVIYKGNTTWKAAKLLGWDKILVQFEDFPSEAAAVAYGIADNKASEFSDWDDDQLLELMSADEMKDLRLDLGFNEAELRGMSFTPDTDKIDKLDKVDSGILASIKIQCKPENRDEIREILNGWAKDCGFDEVVVK